MNIEPRWKGWGMTDGIDSKTVRRAPGRPPTVSDRRPVLDDLDRQIIRILQNNARKLKRSTTK